jgi:hypothetical protein
MKQIRDMTRLELAAFIGAEFRKGLDRHPGA